MQDVQQYIRAGQQARDYYNRNSTQPEVKKKKKKKTKKMVLILQPWESRSLI